jgi:tetratricopeptide (TPR) repeat protein
MGKAFAALATAGKLNRPALHLTWIVMLTAALAIAPMCAQGQAPASQSSQLAPATHELPAELQRARSLADAGNPVQAETVVRQFLAQQADSAEGHFLLGYILFREIQAEARVDGATRYRGNTSLGEFVNGRARASLAEYTEGAKHARPSEFDLKIVASDYILLQDLADADKWLTRAVDWEPKDADAWYNLGRTKYTENKFEEAIHAFQQCLQLDPKNVKAEDNLGLSYYGLGRADDARSAYEAAIQWQSSVPQKDPEPFLDLGTLCLEQGHPKDALPYLLQAIQIAPDEAKGHEKLGKAYSMLDQLPEAQSELQKAVTLAPETASLHYMLGQIYRKQGLVDKANIEFKRVAELNGTHSSDQSPTTPSPQ